MVHPYPANQGNKPHLTVLFFIPTINARCPFPSFNYVFYLSSFQYLIITLVTLSHIFFVHLCLLYAITTICTQQYHHRRYIEADFGFGYNLLPTSVDRVTEGPLQVAFLRSSLSNWSSVVVCSDHVDLSMNNSEMFILLCDFFGSYFWTDQFGHPG